MTKLLLTIAALLTSVLLSSCVGWQTFKTQPDAITGEVGYYASRFGGLIQGGFRWPYDTSLSSLNYYCEYTNDGHGMLTTGTFHRMHTSAYSNRIKYKFDNEQPQSATLKDGWVIERVVLDEIKTGKYKKLIIQFSSDYGIASFEYDLKNAKQAIADTCSWVNQ